MEAWSDTTRRAEDSAVMEDACAVRGKNLTQRNGDNTGRLQYYKLVNWKKINVFWILFQ